MTDDRKQYLDLLQKHKPKEVIKTPVPEPDISETPFRFKEQYGVTDPFSKALAAEYLQKYSKDYYNILRC